MKHYNIIVTGKVQGVFFRQSAMEIANQSGVKGFVRNEPNGNVFIEAEGEEEQLKKLIDWCKKGPTRAIVSEVKISESELKNFSSFEIRR
ncbi:MAG: acylphosphatase [Bacteroidetes bacterium]|nr:acylphosphatase [Bacteroidota bacterium]